MKEIDVGHVDDYFSKIDVVAIKVEKEGISVGDTLHFKGHTTNFTQQIGSMQIEHEAVQTAGVGANVGIKVKERVRKHDHVYKVIED
jgi:putative protease